VALLKSAAASNGKLIWVSAAVNALLANHWLFYLAARQDLIIPGHY
jgi:hypothetical protein